MMQTALDLNDDDDEYETAEEATARLTRVMNADGTVAATIFDPPIVADVGVVVTEYGVFNDPEFWEPLFASGELDDSQRFQLDKPLHSTGSLRSAVRFADLRNLERAEQGKVDKYGHVIVRTRTIVESPWKDVPYGDVDSARRR